MKHVKNQSGFSIIEAMISMAIGIVFLSGVITSWVYCTKNWKQESLQGKLRYDIEKAMERLKEDVRLSDGNNILFYPVGAATYTAFSMPHASVNSSGYLTVSPSSGIAWDRTIIYYIYNNAGTYEFRRTFVNSYSTSSATRQTALDTTVATGSGPAGSTTTVLFSGETVEMEITPTNPTFDGYSASTDRSSNTSFGSIRLTSGTHEIRFRVEGKNALSTGYYMGIDQISLTPSGGSQEAEVLTVSANSGKVINSWDMSSYSSALWGGNTQVEYYSTAVGDYIQFQTYYDQWLESNFANMTHTNTEVVDVDPVVSVATRESQAAVPGWQAGDQTSAEESNYDTQDGNTVRTIIMGSSITKSANMIRFEFRAASSGDLVINSAYFGPQDPVSLENFVAASEQPLYFGNGTVAEGDEDGVGALGATGTTDITIPAGEHAWTNWIEYDIASPTAQNYLVSYSVGASGSETIWEEGATVQSYVVQGDRPVDTWASGDLGYDDSTAVHAVGEMSAWIATGTTVSQVYDTKVTAPAYAQLSFDLSLPAGSTISLQVRSSANEDMSGATAWSAGYAASPAALTLSNLRYLQFMATLTTGSPYTTYYPELDDVKITWPGSTALVEISGYYTKRSNHGTFAVLVDGSATVRALNVALSASQDFQGQNQEFSLSADVKPKNTGK